MKVYIFLLGFCAVLISSMGAGFSVYGLASLFSGAFAAVALMAASLEVGKLVIASFLHAKWSKLPLLLKTYMTIAVCTLMGITSMGIFGFLSNSYQISSMDLNRIQVQIEASEREYTRANDELKRMNDQIAEIPPDQTTKKLMLQKRFEPLLADFTKRANDSLNNVNNLKLEQLKSHSKVGPLIYVAKAFHTDIDTVVKWLIMVFVMVFDPLAVCLVITTGVAVRIGKEESSATGSGLAAVPKSDDKKADEPNVAASQIADGLEPLQKSA